MKDRTAEYILCAVVAIVCLWLGFAVWGWLS